MNLTSEPLMKRQSFYRTMNIFEKAIESTTTRLDESSGLFASVIMKHAMFGLIYLGVYFSWF